MLYGKYPEVDCIYSNCALIRWKRKEVHDIMVDCASLSLDVTEGVGEQSSLLHLAQPPLTAASQAIKYDPAIMSPKQFTSGK